MACAALRGAELQRGLDQVAVGVLVSFVFFTVQCHSTIAEDGIPLQRMISMRKSSPLIHALLDAEQ